MGVPNYTPADHRLAFELVVVQGLSLRKAAAHEGMPGKNTLLKWKGEFKRCRCPWHNWDRSHDKLMQIIEQSHTLAEDPTTTRLTRRAPSPHKTKEMRKAKQGDKEDAGDLESAPPGGYPAVHSEHHPATVPLSEEPLASPLPDSIQPVEVVRQLIWGILREEQLTALKFLGGRPIIDINGDQVIGPENKPLTYPSVVPTSFEGLVRAISQINEMLLAMSVQTGGSGVNGHGNGNGEAPAPQMGPQDAELKSEASGAISRLVQGMGDDGRNLLLRAILEASQSKQQ